MLLAFSPGGERSYAADESGHFCVWSTESGVEEARFTGFRPHTYSHPRFSKSGRRLGWTSVEGGAVTQVWREEDPPDAKPQALRQADIDNEMAGVAFGPDERWIAAATAYKAITFWPLEWPRARLLSGHTAGPIIALRFAPDARTLVSCARDGARVWPLATGSGHQRLIETSRENFCYGIDVRPGSGDIAIAAPLVGLFLHRNDGRPPLPLLSVPNTCVLQAVAFDPEGRRVAVAPQAVGQGGRKEMYVVDSESRSTRSIPLAFQTEEEWQTGTTALAFSWDGALISAGSAGIRRWDLETGESTVLLDQAANIATSAGGRRMVALTGVYDGIDDPNSYADRRLLVMDLVDGSRRPVKTHGTAVTSAALDATGQILVSGDAQGVVRVGRSTGDDPYLLPGHSGFVSAVAVSPDGRWIASAAGPRIRLWPMPDLSKPPLHTLPHDELIAKLKSLTNVRAVRDPESSTGWSIELDSFPGWKEVPEW
ncbi:MAG: hypothetical protein LJF30_24890 [Acidobacteria bacterium]|nr:hypothetical protein [Acidobacteriota bacterium]